MLLKFKNVYKFLSSQIFDYLTVKTVTYIRRSFKYVFVQMFLFRIGPLSAVLVTRLKGTRDIVNNLTFLWFHFNVVAKWHFCFF